MTNDKDTKTAMLDSLATSFRMAANGMPLRFSFSNEDIAELLEGARDGVAGRGK